MASLTLAELEQRIAALEDRLEDAAASDSILPNSIRINPDGTIGGFFPGGIGLVAAPNGNTPASESEIVWTNATGVTAADIFAGAVGIVDELVASADATANSRSALAILRAWRPGTNLNSAELDVAHGTGLPVAADQGTYLRGRVLDHNGTLSQVQLIDAQGVSSFLRLLTDQQLQLAFGAATPTFNNTIGQHVPIAHGLPRTPQAAGVWALDGTEFLTVQQSAIPDGTNLYISANVNGARSVHWMAVG